MKTGLNMVIKRQKSSNINKTHEILKNYKLKKL